MESIERPANSEHLKSLMLNIEDISENSSHKKSYIQQLKQKQMDLDKKRQQMLNYMKKIQDKKATLQSKLDEQISREQELEFQQAEGQAKLEKSRQEVESIREKIQLQKEKQLQNVKDYEHVMSSLATKFKEGPSNYSRDILRAEVEAISNERLKVKDELDSVEEDIKRLNENYEKLCSHLNTEKICDVVNQITKDLEDYNAVETDDMRQLQNELKHLSEISKELKMKHAQTKASE